MQDGDNVVPEILNQRCCVSIGVGCRYAMPVPMIMRRACAPGRAASGADGVRIVVADQTLAVGCMECQRIADPMRPLRRGRNPLHDELHPMMTDGIDDEHGVIEDEEVIEPPISRRFYHSPRRYHRMITVGKKFRRMPEAMNARHPSIARCDMAGAGNVDGHDCDEIATRHASGCPPRGALVAVRFMPVP